MVLKYPMLSEKGIQLLQKSNTIIFIVEMNADKRQIKEEVEKLFKVKVGRVNTMIGLNGVKKAFVRIKDGSAEDIAAKYGLI